MSLSLATGVSLSELLELDPKLVATIAAVWDDTHNRDK